MCRLSGRLQNLQLALMRVIDGLGVVEGVGLSLLQIPRRSGLFDQFRGNKQSKPDVGRGRLPTRFRLMRWRRLRPRK